MFSTNIEANHIQKKGDLYSAARLTDEDKNEIRALARDPRIGALVPQLLGQEKVQDARGVV